MQQLGLTPGETGLRSLFLFWGCPRLATLLFQDLLAFLLGLLLGTKSTTLVALAL
jgi:hypothetical protein